MRLETGDDIVSEDRAQRGLVMTEVLRRVTRLLCQDGWHGPAEHVEAAISALQEDAKQGKAADSPGR